MDEDFFQRGLSVSLCKIPSELPKKQKTQGKLLWGEPEKADIHAALQLYHGVSAAKRVGETRPKDRPGRLCGGREGELG